MDIWKYRDTAFDYERYDRRWYSSLIDNSIDKNWKSTTNAY